MEEAKRQQWLREILASCCCLFPGRQRMTGFESTVLSASLTGRFWFFCEQLDSTQPKETADGFLFGSHPFLVRTLWGNGAASNWYEPLELQHPPLAGRLLQICRGRLLERGPRTEVHSVRVPAPECSDR